MSGLAHLARTVVLAQEICCSCDITFAVPETFQARRKNDGQMFYCPAGHGQHYTDTEAKRLRREVERITRQRNDAYAAATAASDQARAAERSNAALRGVVTKTKRRIGSGVCPCCNRHFANVERHMKGQHPEYADGES